MSNSWMLVALKTPCVHRSQARPLLQLFNGYSKFRPTFPVSYERAWSHVRPSTTPGCRSRTEHRAFSTTTTLCAAKKRKPLKVSPTKNKITPPSSPSKAPGPSPNQAAATSSVIPAKEPVTNDVAARVLTWRDYDPEGGMPLGPDELSAEQIHELFGNDISVDTGNYLLNVINWRRQSGSLIDRGIELPSWAEVTREQALLGLEYIRSLDPDFDEQAAGQQWVEEETERARQEIQARSVQLGFYKAEPEEAEDEIEASKQGTEYGRQRSGESALLRERQRRESEWEEEQARKALEDTQNEQAAIRAQRGPLELGGGVQPTVSLVKHDPAAVAMAQQRERSKAWRQKWEKKATISTTQEIPHLSLLGRLGPASLVLLSSLGLAWFFYYAYTAPPTSARMWPDLPPAIATVSAVTMVLLGSAIACRFPPLWPLVSRYLTIVPAYPYALSIVGAVFRHDRLQHLVSNLVVLWLVGPTLHEDVGRGGFLAIMLASAACGGFATLTFEVLRKSWTSYVYGASNAILGLFAATCAIRPNRTVHAFGYDIPFAAWIFLVLNLGAESVGLLAGLGSKLGIDFAGHIAGQLTGVAAALYLRAQTAGTKTDQVENEGHDQAP